VICQSCAAPVALQDRFCESCGTPVDGDGHRETDLGTAAAITDRGRWRLANEDCYGVHAGPSGLAAVVCDGVSSTADAGRTAEEACRAALEHLVAGIDGPDWMKLAGSAVAAGQDAVRARPGSTTIALGLIGGGRVVAANVGDSRVYWIGADGGHRLLTTDDSGRPHEITAWLGADGDPVLAHVDGFDPTAAGLLVVCTDGLWNYADTPGSMAALLPAAEGWSAGVAARELVDAALAAGGADNVTVAVLQHRGGHQ
jgi:serine/threonine protein phosphatase PrpC